MKHPHDDVNALTSSRHQKNVNTAKHSPECDTVAEANRQVEGLNLAPPNNCPACDARQSFAESLTEGEKGKAGYGRACIKCTERTGFSDCSIGYKWSWDCYIVTNCPIRQRAGLKEVSNGD